mgnify:CR=1 FL=1
MIGRCVGLALLLVAPVQAQVLTHPQEMGLPQSDYVRPDPSDYELALENGLIAYVAEAAHVPLVTMSAFVRAGRVSDNKQGAAESLAHALVNAAPSGMSAAEFRSALERMTAQYTVELHDEWAEVSLNVPIEDLGEALPMFARLLRQPLVTEANIVGAARQATPAASDLGGESGAALYEGSMNAAVGHFYAILYRDHAYGRKPTAQEFDDLTVLDVAAFHARHFVPGNMTLAVAGDIDVDDVNRSLAEYFGDWPSVAVPPPRPMPDVEERRATLHHFPSNKLQSWLVIGHALPKIPADEQAAFDVMDYILGAYHLNTRFMRETRYKYGWTNDASSFPDPRWYGPGAYTFRSYSRPEVIENIYRNMMREIIRLRREPVSDRELFVAKGALADGLFQVRYLDGYALTRSFALERLQYGNHDRSATYVERIRAVTKDDVLDAARKYLRPDEAQVVLLGEAAFDIE